MGFYDWMKEHGIVSIVRGLEESSILPVANAVYAGGIRLLEVTLNTQDAVQMISQLREAFDGKMYIGAGTVLNKKMAEQAAAAGAQYFITPNLDEEVIDYGLKQGIDVVPGVMTPTEIVRAYNAGAKMVKVFPISSLGFKYIKELQGPLSHIPIVAVGGVTIDNVKSFFQAGATGVGVGGSLINKDIVKHGDFDGITKTAQAFVQSLKGSGSYVSS